MLKVVFLFSILLFPKIQIFSQEMQRFKLPQPVFNGNISVEEAILNRRSTRYYSNESLSLNEISQLLWAAQGITKKVKNPPLWWTIGEWQGGYRTAPSAGALYPLEIYLVAGNVENLTPGVYKYLPKNHELILQAKGDKREAIFDVASNQKWIKEASAVIVITAIYERTSVKYGDRAERYVHIEVGHVGQNIFLQAGSLNLGTVMVGAFRDDVLKEKVGMNKNENPLAIMPVGKKK
ncbi:MAG: SagB/ThcOx family dehydrogenase [Ignavibacteria bacterium]|jgi:SagB-type dehydrogenase family enzyme